MTNILVPVSYRSQGENAQLQHITLEAVVAARQIGDVSAVVIGIPQTSDALQRHLSQLGVQRIYAAEEPTALDTLGVSEADVISKIAVDEEISGIVLPDSVLNREIAGRLAARLGSGIAADVITMKTSDSVTHSIFGSQLDVTATIAGKTPIVLLRNGVTDVPEELVTVVESSDLVDIERRPIPDGGHSRTVRVTSRKSDSQNDRPDLAQADIVVAGGRGVGSVENFETMVEGLADALGGAVGATRDAVDLGYCPGPLQIGQTGVTVNPDLYIGIGISGAIQHKAGMQNAKRVVVINNDPEAPLFSIADLGIVGDATEIVPALLKLIKTNA